jgi:hypothetical protein
MNPVYERAIDAILDKVNFVDGARHPDDFECVIDMFDRLLDAGESVKVDEIYQYITKKAGVGATGSEAEETISNVTRETADRIQLIYEVLETAKRKPLHCWGDDYIQGIIKG